MHEVGPAFLQSSRSYLRDEYHPKIRLAVSHLAPQDLWWRPNPASNSVGNLIQHLAGNARQWIVSGIAGATDIRDRPSEFVEDGTRSGTELLTELARTLDDVDRVLARLTPDRLMEPRHIQGYYVSVFQAIYHVVEHFATHTGQITYLTKLRTGKDLAFYRVEGGIAMPQWNDLLRKRGS